MPHGFIDRISGSEEPAASILWAKDVHDRFLKNGDSDEDQCCH
jgi:hypothetical protein